MVSPGGLAVRRGALLLLPALLLGAAYAELFGWQPPPAELGSATEATEEFFFEPGSSSPLFVFGVAAFLLASRRREIRAALADRGRTPAGVAVAAPGGALYFWAQYTGALDLLALSLVLFGLGAALLLAGPRLARAVAAPLVVLLLAVPLPGVLLNQVLYGLQSASASLSAGMLELLGVDVMRQGDMLFANGGAFEVIETCSGLRGMQTLTLAAFAYAELFDRRGAYALALIGMAPAIAFLLNGGRIVSIVLDPASNGPTAHTIQGIVALVLGVLLLYAVDQAMERLAARRARRRGTHAASAEPPAPGPLAPGIEKRSAAVAGVLVLMSAAALLGPEWSPPPKTGAWPVDLPIEFDGFRARKLELDRSYLGSVHFARHLYRAYEPTGAGGAPVDVFVGWNDRRSRYRSLLSPKVEIPGRGHERVEQRPVSHDGTSLDIRSVVTRSRAGDVLSYYWYEHVGEPGEEILAALSGVDSSAFRRERGALVVRIDTPVGRGPTARARAEDRLRRFVDFVHEGVHARADEPHAKSAASRAAAEAPREGRQRQT